MTPVAENTLADIFHTLRRRPDVEAPNLQAWDATDRVLLETAVQLGRAGSNVAVIGDRYGALTLGAAAVLALSTMSPGRVAFRRGTAITPLRISTASATSRAVPLR